MNAASVKVDGFEGALDTFRKVFTVFVVIYPILNRYVGFIPFLTLSESLVFLLLLFAAVRFNALRWKLFWGAAVFAGYLLLDIGINASFLNAVEFAEGAGTAARLIFLYCVIALLPREFFDFRYGSRVLVIVSVFVGLYAVVQVVAAKAGIALTTYLPGLPVMSGDLDAEVRAKMDYGLQFRCQSILNEPAALCCYLLLPISLLLFGKCEVRHGMLCAALLTAVCLVSRSSTGVIGVMLLWVFFVWKKGSSKHVDIGRFYLGIFAGLTVAVALLFGTGIWDYFLDRTFGGNGLAGLSEGTRFYAIGEMFAESDSLHGILFGALVSGSEDYLPGFPRAYYLYGLIGVAIIAVILALLYIKGDSSSRMVVVLFAVLNLGTEIILGNFALYYLAFCVSRNECEKESRTL